MAVIVKYEGQFSEYERDFFPKCMDISKKKKKKKKKESFKILDLRPRL